MATGTAKLQLLIDLKNKLGEGLNSAKKQVQRATGDMKSNFDNLKTSTIKNFEQIKSEIPVVGKAIEMLKNPIVAVMAVVTGAAMAYRKLMDKASEWMKMSRDNAKTEAKLAHIMGNTINASNKEVESIKSLIKQQTKLGIIASDVQTAGAQELSTYISKTDSLKKLIPVMNDMLAQQYDFEASQGSAVNIAGMLGKVMDGQVGALSRYGYKFDENQEKILKFGSEAERVATLVDVITESVEIGRASCRERV